MNWACLLLIFMTLKKFSLSSEDVGTQLEIRKNDTDSRTSKPFHHVGCYNDTRQRAMIHHLGDWSNDLLRNCANISWEHGYEVFGLQNKDECWSSKNASIGYNTYGSSNSCRNGTGGQWANDVYAFNPCPPGHINMNDIFETCQVCPVDTFKENNVSCKKCPGKARTWGRKSVDSISGCLAKNPIKISSHQIYIPQGFNLGIITTVKASYANDSLVTPPLVYEITNITGINKVVSCPEQVSNMSNPFCIYRHNGSIFVNRNNFNCTDDQEFIIKVNVSDSANISSGIISNSNGSVRLICNCKGTKRWYDRALQCTQRNYTVENNGSSQLELNTSNVHAIHHIYLGIPKREQERFNCSLSMKYNKSSILPTVSIPLINIATVLIDNQTVLPVNLAEHPITLDQKNVLNISLECRDDLLNLSNVTTLTFTISPRKQKNCKELNITCLKSIDVWKKGLPICKNDTLELWQRYGHCIGKPKIAFDPDVQRVTSKSIPLRFYCNVTSPVHVDVTWFKRDINNPKLIVGRGLVLKVPAQPYNQSYYWCEATNVFGTTKTPKQKLLVITDYFTSIVQFETRTKGNSKGNLSCVRLCGDIVSGKDYLLGPCLEKRIVNCTFYGKNNIDISNYYEELLATVKSRTAEKHNSSVIVKDAEFCLAEDTGKKNLQGIFSWNSTKIGHTDTKPCPWGPKETTATRKCEGDFLYGGTWKDPYLALCNFKPQNTEALKKLKKIKVDSKNAKEVAQNLTKMMKNSSAKDLTKEDCSLAADIVTNIVAIGDQLNETAGLVLEVIDNIMNMNVATLGESQQAASKIIKALDKVAENIPMDEGATSKVLSTDNLVLQANQVTKSAFKGIRFGVKEDGSVTTNANQSVISVLLPPSILDRSQKTSSRIGIIQYGNNKLFQSELRGNETKISQYVISSSVYDAITSDLKEPVRLKMKREKGQDAKPLGNASCVYWNEAGRNWRGDGCTLCSDQDPSNNTVHCCCSHLTNFAVLFSPQPMTTSTSTPDLAKHTKILSIITYIGCVISLLGVTLTFLTYSLFRHLRKTNQQPIIMNLCAAIGLLLIVFLVGINMTDNRLGCQIVAVLLHYLTLVTVLWMGIEAYNLYLQIVKVMAIYKRKFMLKAALVGWGVPLVVVSATLAAAIIQYRQQNRKIVFYYGNEQVCVLHNHLYRLIGWFAPVLAILFINLIIFILVLYKLHSTGVMLPVEHKTAQRKRCWTAFSIMFLLGLTWLFGALAISDARIVFEYLFCIFNSLQGFFIFFFHCLRIKEVRKQWSFFVSGLGFSHKDSQQSQPRSRGIGESQHSSHYNRQVKVKSWTPIESDNLPRKETILTTIESKNGALSDGDLKGGEIELEDVRLHSNLTTFGKAKKQ